MRIASGASLAIESAKEDVSDSSNSNVLMELASSTLALQTLLYATSAAEEIVNAVVDKLLDLKAVARLVELILDLPSDASKLSKSSKKIVNTTLAILANLTRTERGALELVGTTLPEEAVYNEQRVEEPPKIEELPEDDSETNHKTNKVDDKNDKHIRIKASMELLLDRFMRNVPEKNTTVDLSILEPNEWDAALCQSDPYQHFAALLMNATQVTAGRKFATRIPRSAKTDDGKNKDKDAPQPQSVLQRLLPTLREKSQYSNPFRRRGISGMIRNCCLDNKENAWWLLNMCMILTPLLLPLMGPEELDFDDKKGMDPDLWLDGPDQMRDVDEITRLYCVESILALLATGRASRKTIRVAKSYAILKACDLVESSEVVSERISECVNFLRRDEEGTREGSSDKQVYGEGDKDKDNKNNTVDDPKIAGLLKASPSEQIVPASEEDLDGVD